MSDNWIKEFDKFADNLEMFLPDTKEKLLDFIQSQISQVEKDAIEKTNKRWRERIVNLHKLITPAGFETPDMCFDQLADVDDMLTNLLEESE